MNYLVWSPLYLCLPILYTLGDAECKKTGVVCAPVGRGGEAGRERKDTGKQTQKGSLEYRYLSLFQIGLQIRKKNICWLLLELL